jgi:hypothetical protein
MSGERESGELGERVEVTTDETTAGDADALVAVFHERGYHVERRTFIRDPAEEPRRVVLLALARPLPALVPLVAPPTALPGLDSALVAALYPVPAPTLEGTTTTTTLATVQLKAEGAFASISARTGPDLLDALRVLAVRVRRAAWVVRPLADREHRIAYVDGTWYSE